MRVAISQRVVFSDKGANRDALEHDYCEYYSRFNLHLIPIPNVLSNVAEYLSDLSIDRVILSGGNDVNPTLYGATLEPESSHSLDRDRTEGEIVKFSIENQIPLLAECRGMQFLNVFFGGKLSRVKNHVNLRHKVYFEGNHSREFDLDNNSVNSYHSFGITDAECSDKFQVIARADYSDPKCQDSSEPKLR